MCVSVCRYWALEVKRKEGGRKARLWLVIFKCVWFRLCVQGVLMFIEVRVHLWVCVVGLCCVVVNRLVCKCVSLSSWVTWPTTSPSLIPHLKTQEMPTCMQQVLYTCTFTSTLLPNLPFLYIHCTSCLPPLRTGNDGPSDHPGPWARLLTGTESWDDSPSDVH